MIDTTVQEKNITYPVDSKQHVKIINKCNKIFFKEGLKPRRNYVRTVPKLRVDLRYSNSKKKAALARKARKKFKTIAGRLVRELERKLSKSSLKMYQEDIETLIPFLIMAIRKQSLSYRANAVIIGMTCGALWAFLSNAYLIAHIEKLLVQGFSENVMFYYYLLYTNPTITALIAYFVYTVANVFQYRLPHRCVVKTDIILGNPLKSKSKRKIASC